MKYTVMYYAFKYNTGMNKETLKRPQFLVSRHPIPTIPLHCSMFIVLFYVKPWLFIQYLCNLCTMGESTCYLYHYSTTWLKTIEGTLKVFQGCSSDKKKTLDPVLKINA